MQLAAAMSYLRTRNFTEDWIIRKFQSSEKIKEINMQKKAKRNSTKLL